jgi:hypothetical protein
VPTFRTSGRPYIHGHRNIIRETGDHCGASILVTAAVHILSFSEHVSSELHLHDVRNSSEANQIHLSIFRFLLLAPTRPRQRFLRSGLPAISALQSSGA